MKVVDAYALKDALFQKHVHDGEELEPMLYLDDAMKVVDEAPAVDAVPVIRCQDCKYSIENAKHIDMVCERSYDPDFYCAAGERKGSE